MNNKRDLRIKENRPVAGAIFCERNLSVPLYFGAMSKSAFLTGR